LRHKNLQGKKRGKGKGYEGGKKISSEKLQYQV